MLGVPDSVEDCLREARSILRVREEEHTRAVHELAEREKAVADARSKAKYWELVAERERG